jgi:hypothetical protein
MVMESENGARYFGEDAAFCQRARDAGHRIMADTTIRLYHIGSYHYGWEDAGMAVPRHGTYKLWMKKP